MLAQIVESTQLSEHLKSSPDPEAKCDYISYKKLSYKNMSNLVVTILGIVVIHPPISGLLRFIAEYLESTFNPAKYQYKHSWYNECFSSNYYFVQSGTNFYETYNLFPEYTNQQFCIKYYFYLNGDELDPQPIMITCRLTLNFTEHLDFIFPRDDIDKIKEITEYEIFHNYLYNLYKTYKYCNGEYFMDDPQKNNTMCNNLWNVWNCELKPAILYFINRRIEFVRIGTISSNDSLEWAGPNTGPNDHCT